jgi:hypothetical protein
MNFSYPLKLNCEKISSHLAWGIVSIIGLLSAFFVYYHAFINEERILALLDFTYLVEHAYRIYLGEMPYKDFGLALTPGIFLIQAGVFKLFGLNAHAIVLHACFVSFFVVLLNFYIINKLHKNYVINISLLLPLIFTGQAIFTHANYNMESLFFCLIALAYLLKVLYSQKKAYWQFFMVGILISLPFFIKQNIGLVFQFFMLLSLFLVSLFSKKELLFKEFLLILMGNILIPVIFIVILFMSGVLDDFYYQVFQFPSEVRNPLTKIEEIIKAYLSYEAVLSYSGMVLMGLFLCTPVISHQTKSFILPLFAPVILFFTYLTYFRAYNVHLETVIGIHFMTIVIIIFFLANVYKFILNTSGQLFVTFVPMVLLATSVSVFLSYFSLPAQIENIYFLLIAIIAAHSIQFFPNLTTWNIFYVVIGVLFSFQFYGFANTKFFWFPTYSTVHEVAAEPKLRGLGTRDEWFPKMEQLFQFADKHIKNTDKVVTLPGEDPFYYATGRIPPLAYLQANPHTFVPYNVNWFFQQCLEEKVKWIIVKKHIQNIPFFYLDITPLLKSNKIPKYYNLYADLGLYYIYKRNRVPVDKNLAIRVNSDSIKKDEWTWFKDINSPIIK